MVDHGLKLLNPSLIYVILLKSKYLRINRIQSKKMAKIIINAFYLLILFLTFQSSHTQYNQIENVLFFQQNSWDFILNSMTQGSSV